MEKPRWIQGIYKQIIEADIRDIETELDIKWSDVQDLNIKYGTLNIYVNGEWHAYHVIEPFPIDWKYPDQIIVRDDKGRIVEEH